MMAALTSAAMPNVSIAGARPSEQTNSTDESYGIDHAVVQDSTGRLYDVFVSSDEKGRKRLEGRVRAAQTLVQARELAGLGFELDRIVAFSNANQERCATADTSVMVTAHHSGQARRLDLLTLDDCSSVGTTLGAIHRIRPDFLQAAQYPTYTTGQIRTQLTAWIKRLRQAGHVPQEITDSWANIIETDGLWSFATCPVHGGLHDGDLLFSGSSITAVTNWQDMQVNDPARDLAWIFARLDENHRNALLSAYGRILGNRLDDLIMLRANLWLQMEQVGDFISALNQADNAKIMMFKAQVERLAHQLGVATSKNRATNAPQRGENANGGRPPSTITVGTLLDESARRRNAAHNGTVDANAERRTNAGINDMAGNFNRSASRPAHTASTASNETTEVFSRPDSAANADSASRTESATSADSRVDIGFNSDATPKASASHDDTNDQERTPISTFVPQYPERERHESMPSSSTAVISRLETADGFDAAGEHIPASHSEATTMLIPLLQRDEATMQRAQEQINEWEAQDATGERPNIQ